MLFGRFLWFFSLWTPRDYRETIANDFWVRRGCVRRARARSQALWALKTSKIHRKPRVWVHIPYCGIAERCAIHWWFWRFFMLFSKFPEIFVFKFYESIRNRSQMVSGCARMFAAPSRPLLCPLSFKNLQKTPFSWSVRANILVVHTTYNQSTWGARRWRQEVIVK